MVGNFVSLSKENLSLYVSTKVLQHQSVRTLHTPNTSLNDFGAPPYTFLADQGAGGAPLREMVARVTDVRGHGVLSLGEERQTGMRGGTGPPTQVWDTKGVRN